LELDVGEYVTIRVQLAPEAMLAPDVQVPPVKEKGADNPNSPPLL
jgi:hypothetical protein